jgi:hypothetical protein
VALGSLILVAKLPSKLALLLTLGFASVFFLSSTGVLAEITGGYITQLHLHNKGQYYESYYLHDGESAALRWLNTRPASQSPLMVASDIDADRYGTVRSGTGFPVQTGLYPGLIQKDAYVYLGNTLTSRGIAYELFNNEGITFHYPTKFLDNNKNLIYSNGQSSIYR